MTVGRRGPRRSISRRGRAEQVEVGLVAQGLHEGHPRVHASRPEGRAVPEEGGALEAPVLVVTDQVGDGGVLFDQPADQRGVRLDLRAGQGPVLPVADVLDPDGEVVQADGVAPDPVGSMSWRISPPRSTMKWLDRLRRFQNARRRLLPLRLQEGVACGMGRRARRPVHHDHARHHVAGPARSPLKSPPVVLQVGRVAARAVVQMMGCRRRRAGCGPGPSPRGSRPRRTPPRVRASRGRRVRRPGRVGGSRQARSITTIAAAGFKDAPFGESALSRRCRLGRPAGPSSRGPRVGAGGPEADGEEGQAGYGLGDHHLEALGERSRAQGARRDGSPGRTRAGDAGHHRATPSPPEVNASSSGWLATVRATGPPSGSPAPAPALRRRRGRGASGWLAPLCPRVVVDAQGEGEDVGVREHGEAREGQRPPKGGSPGVQPARCGADGDVEEARHAARVYHV